MSADSRPPLLQLTGVWRSYPAGDQPIDALKDVSLSIEAGEMVAIIGQSGSGKSTLMNILGCLDRPSRGSYKIAGRAVLEMTPDDLAALRRQHFGFIFQRYHLLPDLDAQGNVEAPAIYAGAPARSRRDRAVALLTRLGLADRLNHRPSQLSGGQQQRVSVARALMNGGEVILADEPTGALDTKSGGEIMKILQELNAEGHTIILVTHDPKVAENARRIIEISDGEILSDRRNGPAHSVKRPGETLKFADKERLTALVARLGDAFHMALLAMNAHRLRTVLTMLGVIIGIASVVSILAIVGGAQKSIMTSVGSMGSDTVNILAGASAGDTRVAQTRGLRPSDLSVLAGQPYIDSVSPTIVTSRLVRAGSASGNGTINGVGEQYFRVQNTKLAQGRMFDAAAVTAAAQEAVIDDKAAKKLFENRDPLGQTILLGNVPLRVVGVTAKAEGMNVIFQGSKLQVWAPYTTVMARMVRQPDVSQISVRLADGVSTPAAETAITNALITEHGKQDFFLRSSDSMRKQLGQITLIFSLLLGSIGGISLFVGGIGVMNIMLVSVSERTREIGVRTAVGARRSDIMSQFMIEAVLVCLIGGALGIGLSFMIAAIFSLLVKTFQLVYSAWSVLLALGISTLVGLVFGWLPARNAAALDPVDALARE
ncbi:MULTISPECIES: MacB family efflux pump subunit [unclassified Caulobacter]|uniref:MacB family efflux pump subunit n=1 Tax=unclassified Caulobacter TaxID=2648921 RepID=UPI0006FB518E|nr:MULTISPECIES: MacB family efflux pump subunit [unclassified Caulobacter]KQV55616.1 macrolide transporter [Caulobacter sp. Root342]KQV63453.1 macrolide transporter [Caulobacter sp. Root343]